MPGLHANGYFREYYRRNADRIKDRSRQQRINNPGLVKAYNLKRFGITPVEYKAIYDSQHGLCAACSRSETRTSKNGLVAPLCVDHDHITGKVRGLLCSNCNLALGHVKDDVIRLEQLIKYLKGGLCQ